MFERILVATDGSDLGDRAVEHAAELSQRVGAQLTIVVVQPPAAMFLPDRQDGTFPQDLLDQLTSARSDEFNSILHAGVAKAQAAGLDAAAMLVEQKQPYEGILQAAEDCDASLVVMGSTGRTGDRFPLGSEAMKVLSLSRIPVHIVK